MGEEALGSASNEQVTYILVIDGYCSCQFVDVAKFVVR
jgi:hypothetical protein